MRVVLAICREHGQPPSWFDTLTRGDQVALMADYNLRAEESS